MVDSSLFEPIRRFCKNKLQRSVNRESPKIFQIKFFVVGVLEFSKGTDALIAFTLL